MDIIKININKEELKDSHYELDTVLSLDANDDKLGTEDNFNDTFIKDLKESLVPDFIDMERIKFVPSIGKNILASEMEFCLHFIKRKEINDDERHLNSIFTSGNVYHDSWHVDPETRETTWWNGFDYSEPYFDTNRFNEFNYYSGASSDLIGYLNFTDNDIFYRKKKVSQSFLRLSFYTSKNPLNQKLLFYSTIFLDGGELYGKYIKQLNNIKKEDDKINENAFIVLYPGGTRVDSKITVSHEYNKNKSSEGFNIYLFNEVFSDNMERTIYMKIEFNHAGNGKTTPLIIWPRNENGSFCALTTENFLNSLYIEVKLLYNKETKKFMYYFPNVDNDGDKIIFKLYEPKLDMIDYNK